MYTRDNLSSLLDLADVTKYAGLGDSKVLLRACLNVAVDKTGNITDRTRLDEAYPTIKYLAANSQKLIITAHMGRPTIAREPNFSLRKVYEIINAQLQTDLGLDCQFAENIADAANSTAKVVVLENIRFFVGEESSEKAEQDSFVKELSSLADIYVNDAFPDYREAVSTYYIARKLKPFIGPNLAKEVRAFAKLSSPSKPYVAILGGAKLSEKLDTLLELLKSADKVLIGGAMAYTILKAQGNAIGNSLHEDEKIAVAQRMLVDNLDKLVLPVDHLVAESFDQAVSDNAVYTDSVQIPAGTIAIDIGPKTIEKFVAEIAGASTLLVNGPMGVFEWEKSLAGTKQTYDAVVANTNAYKIIGGGDSISAMNKLGIANKFNHISTGGGSMLAFLAKDKFPIVDVILDHYSV